ncbi:uncharacterized protein LOC133183175 [Saccostrea echinata]|uniref:uncharacterized protein LOC133183175 n=1 Tax=Saccostrea echinata TaxID=191078 RepID=UPI002A82F21C|nr:uncharacterized protein LOC133183175 [Saccostrea echinata]
MATSLLPKHTSDYNDDGLSEDVDDGLGEEVDSAVQPIISLVIANVGGPSVGPGTADKRKKGIAEFLKEFQPNIVLLQEFSWSGITGSAWRNVTIPEKYEYTGNNEASILFDKNEFIVEFPGQKELQSLLDEMIRKVQLPIGFTPLSRMCIRIIQTKGVPDMKFLCVSWHGRRKGKMTELIMELKNLLIFIETFSNNKDLPFIIAGDFNISLEEAVKLVQSPHVIYKYQPLRREGGKIIDFFIGSELLPLDKMSAIDWEKVDSSIDALKIFDHDPIYAQIGRTLPKKIPDPSTSKQKSAQQPLSSRVKKQTGKTRSRKASV